MFKKVLSILLVVFMIQIPQISFAADPSINAEGSDGAITISWEAHPDASYYDVVMIRPEMESLSGIFSGTEWVVGDAEPDTKYSFFVTAYDSNLNQIYRYDEVSAETDAAKSTLTAPCNKILAFTINQKQYTIDGEKSEMSTAPIIKGGRSFLVIRYVVEPIMGEIGWEGSTKKITISALGHEIEMWIGKPIALVDGVERPIDPNNAEITPFIENGRTLVPLRFPVEALGSGSISWFGDTKTAVLTFPMGCESGIIGRITNSGEGFLEVSSDSGQKVKFDIDGTSPFINGSCVNIKYEKIGDKNIIGSITKAPCDMTCTGEKVAGEVKVITGDEITIEGLDGKWNTYKYSTGILKPKVGQKISGCVDGETLTKISIDLPSKKDIEGEVLKKDCDNNQVMISSGDKTLRVELRDQLSCDDFPEGDCVRISAESHPLSPDVVFADSVKVVPCGERIEKTLYVQNFCESNAIEAMDIEGNSYAIELPTSQLCASLKPGNCILVNGTISGTFIFAEDLKITDAPKEDNYLRGVISSLSPLKVSLPAGSEFSFDKPKYFGADLTIGLGIELWGSISDDFIRSVKINILSGFPSTITGRVIGAVCQAKKILIINSDGKFEIKLPENIKCEDIQTGSCINAFGESSDDSSFDSALVQIVPCESECYGQTFEGIIISTNCDYGEVSIIFEDTEYTVKVPTDTNCSELSIGSCVKICGSLDGKIITSDSFEVFECLEPDCASDMIYGIVSSIDHDSREIIIETEDETISSIVPITTDIDSLVVSDCVEFCGNKENPEFMSRIFCEAIDDVISGTVKEAQDNGYLITTKDEELLLVTNKELSVGMCIKAIGTKKLPTFTAKIVSVVPCSDSPTLQGEIVGVDCWSKTISIKTSSGTDTVTLGEKTQCEDINLGDCIIYKTTDDGPEIEITDCSENITDTIQIAITSADDGWIYGTTLDTKKAIKVRTSENFEIGDLLLVDGHRVNSSTFDNTEISEIGEKFISKKSGILLFEGWEPNSKVCFLSDNLGTKHIAISPEIDFSEIKIGSYVGIDMLEIDGGYGIGSKIITNVDTLSKDDFEFTQVVGVIFGIDTVDSVILLHTYEGDNVIVSPSDSSVLKTLKTGDCAIAKGNLKLDTMWITEAAIEASDCMGGEIGRQFTGVVVGIDAVAGRLQVASDNGEILYTVWLEAVSQLTGLTLGDCVSCSGVLIKKDDESNLLGREVTRIDCLAEANKPILIEGEVDQIDEDAGFVRIITIDKTSWKAFLAEDAKNHDVEKGDFVRCSGRLQAKKGIIAKAFITPITPATFYWSVSGEVTATEDKSFVLKDSDGRDWKMKGNKLPEAGDKIFAVGILPIDGFASLDDVNWISMENWEEPITKISGVVFGLSCGMDNLLLRDKFATMTSIRLPKTGFCGYFTVGECIDMKGRLMANIHGMAKVTSVTQSTENCFEREVAGRVVARSLVDKVAVLLTSDGTKIRLGFETEAKCVKAEVGKLYSATGRFMPYAPDILKVDSLSKINSVGSYSAEGIIVAKADEVIYLKNNSGKIVRVTLPEDSKSFDGMIGCRVTVEGEKDTDSSVNAKSISVVNDEDIAIELVGKVIKSGNGYALLSEEETGKIWRIESDDDIALGNSFVVGWQKTNRHCIITGAKVIKIDNEPTTQVLMWGVVKTTDCDNNIVDIQLDDGTVYEVHSGYYGQCETFTPGELVQIVGQVQPKSGKVITGARMLRPGLVGDRKVIVGVVTEVSCTSRIVKLQEDDRGDISGNNWVIRLSDDVVCEDIEVGDRIKVEGDPVTSEKYVLEDATISSLTQKIQDAKIQGKLVTFDRDENILILLSEGRYYRIVPKNGDAFESTLFVGDEIIVTAKIASNRKTILKEATWEIVPDEKAYIVLHGWVDVASCPKIRFYTNDEEFWRINIEEGEPCEMLNKGSRISVKGLKDLSQDHLMHHAMILNYMKKTVFMGIIDEINCSTGIAIVDMDGAKMQVHLETGFDGCLQDKFSKGDAIQVTGWKHDLYQEAPVYFAEFERFGNSAGMIPVDFTGEVLINPDCKKNEVQVASSHVIWRVRLPDGYDCNSITQGDWIHIKGGIEDWDNKIILGESIEKGQACIFGSIARANYSKNELFVQELEKDQQWTVTLQDTSKTSQFRTGDFAIFYGESSSSNRMSISNATGTKLQEIEGVVDEIDLASQSITVINGKKKYKVMVKTDWITVSDFEKNKGVFAAGIKTDKKAEDGSIIYENCYIKYDMKLDPKSTGSSYPKLLDVSSCIPD